MTAGVVPPAAPFSAARVVTVTGGALPPPVVVDTDIPPLPAPGCDAQPRSGPAAGGSVHVPLVPPPPVPADPPVPAAPAPPVVPPRPLPAPPADPPPRPPAPPPVPAEPALPPLPPVPMFPAAPPRPLAPPVPPVPAPPLVPPVPPAPPEPVVPLAPALPPAPVVPHAPPDRCCRHRRNRRQEGRPLSQRRETPSSCPSHVSSPSQLITHSTAGRRDRPSAEFRDQRSARPTCPGDVEPDRVHQDIDHRSRAGGVRVTNDHAFRSGWRRRKWRRGC